jgi:hypothetical protein
VKNRFLVVAYNQERAELHLFVQRNLGILRGKEMGEEKWGLNIIREVKMTIGQYKCDWVSFIC